MEHAEPHSALEQIGFVVIGRNEGRILGNAFDSLPSGSEFVVYVDSGSTDKSVQIAVERGIPVWSLDPSSPFSAARARREGVSYLLERQPLISMIQFLDGDCVLHPEWVSTSVEYLRDRPAIGVICGVLTERASDASIYNRFNAVRWRAAPIGTIATSGGIFMARAEAYAKAGGFRSELLTGEESDFCRRVWEAGYEVARIPVPMASHDSELLRFRDWWARAVWGGKGDAVQAEVLGSALSLQHRREIRSVVIWAIVLPIVIVATSVISFRDVRLLWGVAAGLAVYAALAGKVFLGRIRRGERWLDAATYSALAILRKLPYAVGYFGHRFRNRR